MAAMRMAQYGTKHGHAAGKLAALQSNPDVELVGVWEPDPQRRRDLEAANGPYRDVHWFRDAAEMLEDRSIVAIASEGRNDESLGQTEETVRADKHVWYDRYCCSRMGRYNDYPGNDERRWLWSAFDVEVNGPDAMARHALVANAGAATIATDGLLPAHPAPSQIMIFPTTSLPWPSAGTSGIG